MNERDFKAKLRKHIKPHAYIQSVSSLANAGTPDLWVSGKKDLWIEVKWDDKTKGPITPKLSALQRAWLHDRWVEGRNVCVIVGTAPNEGIIYWNKQWETSCSGRISFEEIITRIIEYVT
jgi:hypothetical protein